MPESASAYRGRFAPSPTGPLHLGSLITALASYLDARHHRGTWLVRMENLDPPREEAGAAERILQSLQSHGLLWDEDILFQSTRAKAYESALAKLASEQRLFYCDCSRTALGPDGNCGGDCAVRQETMREPRATRVRVPSDCRIEFQDQLQGPQQVDLGSETSDFVVKRKDGLDAYQLAVVIDDDTQKITHIVRGSDLLEPTARQIFLQQVLGCLSPQYCHVPVITNVQGQKFSKQNQAPALDDDMPVANLRQALVFLHQVHPPANITTVAGLMDFAIAHWVLHRIPATMSIPASRIGLPL